MMLSTPSGSPACAQISARTARPSGVSGGGLHTKVHPAASAGASFMRVSTIGPFHGTMPATTPTGSLTIAARRATPSRVCSNSYRSASSA
jgi:hypothetical protein